MSPLFNLTTALSGPPAPVKAILKQFSSGREEDKMSGYVLPYLLSKLFQLHFHLPLWHRCINVINTALFSLFFLTSFFFTWKFQIYWNNRNQFNWFDSFCDFAYLYTFIALSMHCSVLFLFQFCQLIYSFTNLFICLSLHFMIFF